MPVVLVVILIYMAVLARGTDQHLLPIYMPYMEKAAEESKLAKKQKAYKPLVSAAIISVLCSVGSDLGP